MQHLLSMNHLTKQEIENFIKTARTIECDRGTLPMEQTFASNIFLEPSTRTKNSFYIAERRLGMDILDLNGVDSSVTKGETLEDTLKTLEALGVQLAVVRQPETGILQQAAQGLSSLSIINAGDGTGEHPTQSLLDLYTISKEFPSFENLRVTIAGDIKHSRVARSNAYALEKLGAKVSFVAPVPWRDESISTDYITMDEACVQSDVVMLLRIQHERHVIGGQQGDYLQEFGLTKQREQRMKDDAIILHPAPVNRGVEIESSLVECRKSRIFDQMANGVVMRMAIIQTLLKGELAYEYKNYQQQTIS
ncbi:aspartate carbamoyltransferase catalytic subunit [Halobacillus shinanisalinarum]|uniref:Aspartate carbamoyltransferase n=1 Tax=Halobacillus shinanisalinarum TaxID=2932258 RepID=A0ABY4GYL2_9BACI|nr:aspartate carbamoyltransferase catalytic subunit [Halobacillus shinanisalinarum]UOQ93106.1 aspartate carbamoyltransferase catalytic subunit [Halobacillus shinanisalinarum]